MHHSRSIDAGFEKRVPFHVLDGAAVKGICLGVLQAAIIFSAFVLQTCTQYELQQPLPLEPLLDPTEPSHPLNEVDIKDVEFYPVDHFV